MRSGRRAGTKVPAVIWGFNDYDRLKSEMPDAVAQDVDEVARDLRRLDLSSA